MNKRRTMRISRRLTSEERVAMKIADLLCDLRLDIDLVGVYFSSSAPFVAYNRLQYIAETAKNEKENSYEHKLF
jgi:hypothetical protein